MQKISPDGKAKVQLQIVLHDGNNSTFHFVNKNGTQKQIQDRERVKEIIQSILPNFKPKIDSELERKNKVLTDNPRLLQLYKDLVISKVLTSEEFWTIHEKELAQLTGDSTTKQEIGVSGSFLSEIKPVSDGCNGFKYNLTAEIIESIFKAYPAVKKKYSEAVPKKLSESEFWTKFFQSHYFHRDRVATGLKDIFSECGKIDDNILKRDIRRNMNDPFLNINRFGDNTIEEGFCSSSVTDPKEATDTSNNSANVVHQSIIKRFNQHSFLVLKTCKDHQHQPPPPPPVAVAPPVVISSNGTAENSIETPALTEKQKRKNNQEIIEPFEDVDTEEMHKIKRQKIIEKIHYDDLGNDDEASESHRNANEKGLNLEKLEKHLFGSNSMPENKNSAKNHYDKKQSVEAVDYSVRNLVKDWNQRTTHRQLINPTTAVNALGELSPGGILMRGYHNLSNFVPMEIEKEVCNLYLSAGELLKEFWSAFPPINAELENKAIKMHDTLQRFNSSKLKAFEDRVSRDLSPLGSQILFHLNLLMDTAFKKFQRRIKK